MEQESKKFRVNPIVLLNDIKDICLMFWYVLKRKYPLPIKSLVWFIVGLVYIIVPFDLIPDFFTALFGIGALDDLMIVIFVINKMRPDLEQFLLWKYNKKGIKNN